MTIIRSIFLSLIALCIYGTANASVLKTNLSTSEMGINASIDANTLSSNTGEQYAGIRWIGDKDEDAFAMDGGSGNVSGSGSGAIGTGNKTSIGGTTTTGMPNRYECPEGFITCTNKQDGLGVSCGGKFKRCRCKSKYRYSEINCSSTDGYKTSGDSCKDAYEKWEKCKCDVKHVECEPDYECTGWKCNDERCVGCRCKYSAVRCGSGQSCSGSIVCNGLCNGSCYTPPPPPPPPTEADGCPIGYSSSVTSCSETESFSSKGSSSDGKTCGRCTGLCGSCRCTSVNGDLMDASSSSCRLERTAADNCPEACGKICCYDSGQATGTCTCKQSAIDAACAGKDKGTIASCSGLLSGKSTSCTTDTVCD